MRGHRGEYTNPLPCQKSNHVVRLITSHYNNRVRQVEYGTQRSDTSIDKANVRKEGRMCKVINKWRNLLTLRRLMSYIYGAPILDVSRSHTTTQHSR